MTASQSGPLLEIDDLRTYYDEGNLFGEPPVKAVDGVSLRIQRGETLGLVGESGCGKTTLGRTLIRLESATGGAVRYDGKDIISVSSRELKSWRRDAQMVFQDPESSLNDRMTVGEIIREPLDVHDWKTPKERRKQVREMLEAVGLTHQHYYRYPHQFSGGQRQRIGIARALAIEPDFVVLDEPVSALDVSVQAQILNLLRQLQEEFGLTYLFIAHDLSVVRHICDRVAVMYLGQIMERGPTEELFSDPQHPYTRSLLSAIPEPDPLSDKKRIPLRGTPPSPRDPPQGCPFTTRCPMKIPPEEFADLSDELWTAIEIYREVVRMRTRADRSVTEYAREMLGLSTRFSSMDAIRSEVFEGLDVPSNVESHIDRAATLVEDNEEEQARAYLRDTFGSICDEEHPPAYDVSDSRFSRCHRHDDAYTDPDELSRTSR